MGHALDSLRRSPLLRGLSDSALSAIGAAVVRRTYAAGETILLEGDPSHAAYVVERGQVRVYRTSLAGREQVLAVLGEGDAFNTAPVFQHEGRNRATAQAITDTSVFVIRRAELLAAVRESSELALALLRHFAERLDDLTNLVEDLSLRTVRGRLARFLLRNADEGAVRRRWTQDEIASQIGTVRDVVGRSLRAFEDDGIVRIDRHRIILVNREALEAATET